MAASPGCSEDVCRVAYIICLWIIFVNMNMIRTVPDWFFLGILVLPAVAVWGGASALPALILAT
jgi:hypothetical protein